MNKMIKNPNYVPNVFPGNKNPADSKNEIEGWSFVKSE